MSVECARVRPLDLLHHGALVRFFALLLRLRPFPLLRFSDGGRVGEDADGDVDDEEAGGEKDVGFREEAEPAGGHGGGWFVGGNFWEGGVEFWGAKAGVFSPMGLCDFRGHGGLVGGSGLGF